MASFSELDERRKYWLGSRCVAQVTRLMFINKMLLRLLLLLQQLAVGVITDVT